MGFVCVVSSVRVRQKSPISPSISFQHTTPQQYPPKQQTHTHLHTQVTNDELLQKREAKVAAISKKHPGAGYRSFEECSPLTPLTAGMTACFAACHPLGGDACLACGYDEAAAAGGGGACVCKTPAGEVRRVATTPKEAFGIDWGSGGGKRGKRVGETLVFPGLISEADCQRMDAYLEELVAREKTPRKIVEEADSPLHALLGGALGAVVPDGVEYLDHVTFSKEAVEVTPHYDGTKGGETHKVLLFLDGTAGTRFWETQQEYMQGECPMELPAARGTVVVFPMSLYHDSQAYRPRGAVKSTLGLRAVLPAFEGSDTLGLVRPA